ncbi:UNKNOWN [Stylonychia lemnae]|uniref:Uncharacterized protein n=1 Tax=Stylonychia lemnae TaxID=5949 RepID=A0A077ZQY5_STYLE|nr:UNKNOWN [Stylonychia lemnae]|eukprot:CDW72313.1 UNKNOWN [Stylonychia lemnae]
MGTCSSKKEKIIIQPANKKSIFDGFCMGSKQQHRKYPYQKDSTNDESADDVAAIGSKAAQIQNTQNDRLPIHLTFNYQIIETTKFQTQHFHNSPSLEQNTFQINKQSSLKKTHAQIILSKYEYYSDINPHDPNAHIQLMIIERDKRQHHQILLQLLSFLNLQEIIKIGRLNRKLYIVSGDISLLRNYTRQQSQFTKAQNKNSEMITNKIRSSLEYQRMLIDQQLYDSQNKNYIYSVTDQNPHNITNNVGNPQQLNSSEPAAQNQYSQYDIILDKNCQKVELQNQIFIINNSSQSGSKSSANKNQRMNQNSNLLIQDFEEYQYEEGDFDNVFMRVKKLEFEAQKSPQSKNSSKILIRTDNDQIFKRHQTQDPERIEGSIGSNYIHKVRNLIMSKQSQESINQVHNYGHAYFNRIKLEKIKNDLGYNGQTMRGPGSSRFGSHALQSVVNSSQLMDDGGASHRTPSFIHKMRDSSARMMMSNILMSNRNSNIIFESQDSDLIYGGGGGVLGTTAQFQTGSQPVIHQIDSASQFKKNNGSNSSKNQTSKPSGFNMVTGKEFVNIKLGHNTVLLLQTPDGTTATIMPIQQDSAQQNQSETQDLEIPTSEIHLGQETVDT